MREKREEAPRPDDMTAEGSSTDDAFDPLEQAGEEDEEQEGRRSRRRAGPPPEADMYRDIPGDRVGG